MARASPDWTAGGNVVETTPGAETGASPAPEAAAAIPAAVIIDAAAAGAAAGPATGLGTTGSMTEPPTHEHFRLEEIYDARFTGNKRFGPLWIVF
jgi:hypothetical protein